MGGVKPNYPSLFLTKGGIARYGGVKGIHETVGVVEVWQIGKVGEAPICLWSFVDGGNDRPR